MVNKEVDPNRFKSEQVGWIKVYYDKKLDLRSHYNIFYSHQLKRLMIDEK